IGRYLHVEPVEAGPPGTMYRLKKYALKYRRALATAGAFVIVLLIATAVSSVAAIRAIRAEGQANEHLGRVQQEEKKARQSESEAKAVLEFFEDKVLAATRPEGEEGGIGKDVTIRDTIDAAEPIIAASFQDQPTVEASIRHTLSATYHHLGEPAL